MPHLSLPNTPKGPKLVTVHDLLEVLQAFPPQTLVVLGLDPEANAHSIIHPEFISTQIRVGKPRYAPSENSLDAPEICVVGDEDYASGDFTDAPTVEALILYPIYGE